ncbi:mannosylphosphate transferase [Metarhizium rileyi]|uniref:Mannosylphosphate transferase n=1 Tax=Metarhizium rileyi (strain RCEF 4871) TaxID=1649241 RepID=A0A167GUG3_METRR|nr:mannosylphosphate transferase [Metarhizium rileyi RCEF 4871]
MVVARAKRVSRIFAAAFMATILTVGYVMLQSPRFIEAGSFEKNAKGFEKLAEVSEKNAHKNIVPGSTKYFSEPGGSYDRMHYDIRYYQKKLGAAERRTTLEDLIHSYLNVTNYYEIETWLAHGTLMGWWWGGRIMPWDSDIDVQLSYETLDYLASELNFTEFRYNITHENGNVVSRSYLLDINPYYNETGVGDGNNIIDARWIDTDSGMFVDITALRKRDDSGKLSCKNHHYYTEDELWPLKESEFEGAKAWIPAKPTILLRDEYGPSSTENGKYKGYVTHPENYEEMCTALVMRNNEPPNCHLDDVMGADLLTGFTF